MWALLELLKCSVQTASGKEKGHPSCELSITERAGLGLSATQVII